MGIGAAWFGRSIRFLFIGTGGRLDSSVEVEIEGEWTRLAETWSEARLSYSIFTTGLLVRF